MKIYTYYDPTVFGGQSQSGLMPLWENSWRKQGWTPQVLTPADARRHSRFTEVRKQVEKFPTINLPKYEMACYLRWLALAARGGGWMTDYDVMNRSFKPRKPIFPITFLDQSYVPCVVGSSKIGSEAVLNYLVNFQVGERTHVSDMVIFNSHRSRKSFGPPQGGVAEFQTDGWAAAPLVHFSADKCRAFHDKCEAINANFRC